MCVLVMVHTTALIIFLFIVQTIIAVPDRLDDKEKDDQSSCVHRDKHTHMRSSYMQKHNSRKHNSELNEKVN